jgi:S1-C subfamily serine protease
MIPMVRLSDTEGIDDSPAAAAGLREGDLLVAADDTELRSIVTLHHALAAARRSGILHLRIERATHEQTVTVTFP